MRALALRSASLFVGGDFTRVHGQTRGRLAEVDSTTGALGSLRRDANAPVRSVAVVGDRLYAGGDFSSVGGTARARLAALTLPSGAPDAGFRPAFNGSVYAVTATPDGSVVLVGGGFTTVNGSSTRRYLASFTRAGAVRAPVFALGPNNPVLSLDTNDDGSRVFAGVGGDKTGNQAAAFDAATGAKRWYQRAEGDVQAVAHHAGNVFFGFHEGFAGDMSVRLLAADASTGRLEPDFRPTVNSFWGVWALAATAQGVVAGGEFTAVSGTRAGRLAFFDAARMPTQPPSATEPPATITGLTLAAPSPPVVVLGPRGRVSATASVRVGVTWPATVGRLSAVTVTGVRQGSGAPASLRFRAVCGSTASCTVSGNRTQASVPLTLTGGGRRLDPNRIAALANPGVYALRPSGSTAAGAAVGYAGPPVRVQYLRATRITAFNASPEPVRAGAKVRLRGTASKATVCAAGSRAVGCRAGQLGRWLPVARRSVSLYFDPVGPAPSRLVAAVRPDANGRFTVRLRQDVAGTWRAELRQTATFGAARSRADLVNLRA